MLKKNHVCFRLKKENIKRCLHQKSITYAVWLKLLSGKLFKDWCRLQSQSWPLMRHRCEFARAKLKLLPFFLSCIIDTQNNTQIIAERKYNNYRRKSNRRKKKMFDSYYKSAEYCWGTLAINAAFLICFPNEIHFTFYTNYNSLYRYSYTALWTQRSQAPDKRHFLNAIYYLLSLLFTVFVFQLKC